MADLHSVDFGNPLLSGLRPIEMPVPVSWWPETGGWLVLGVCVCLFVGRATLRRFRRWRRDAYRRKHLAEIDRLLADSEGDLNKVTLQLAPLLKSAALQAYGRNEVAALSGTAWLEFLDAHYQGSSYGGRCFLSDLGASLIRITYERDAVTALEPQTARQLIEITRAWIAGHRREEQIGA
ncbi:MAG: DUF4381 domain-containing protein [Pseudomonadales bacterium]|nr:DUF4381 domain-containing protein [Pseudomonadales bacterium]